MAACATTSPFPFATDADPAHYPLLFENDDIRVVRITYGPGEEASGTLWHPYGGVLIFGASGTSSHWLLTFPDGSTFETEPTTEAFGAECTNPGAFHGKNLSNVRQEIIRVEFKRAGLGKTYCLPPPG